MTNNFFLFPLKKEEEFFLSSKFSYLRRLVFNQSAPVHPVSDSRGGPLSMTDIGQRTKEKDGNSCVLYWIQNLKGWLAGWASSPLSQVVSSMLQCLAPHNCSLLPALERQLEGNRKSWGKCFPCGWGNVVKHTLSDLELQQVSYNVVQIIKSRLEKH